MPCITNTNRLDIRKQVDLTEFHDSLVSIIIPAYKIEPYLRQCLDSVLHQTYTNLEIILIDDESPDKCPAICDEYANKNSRVKVIHQKNQGLSAARNKGLDNASGEFIYFLDGDDYIEANTIQTLKDHLKANEHAAIAIGYYTAVKNDQLQIYKKEWIFKKKSIIKPQDFTEAMLSEKFNFAATAKLYRRDVFKNLRFQEKKKNEDTLLIADMATIVEEKQYECINIPIYSYFYRQRDDSICHSKKDILEWHVINNYETIIQKFIDRPNIVQILRKKQYDTSFRLQSFLLKEKPNQTFFENQQFIKRIPISFALKKHNFKFLIYFLLLKYVPSILRLYYSKK